MTGSILNMVAFYHDPKGEGHAYMDVGSRAMQEQLPRKPGITAD